VYEGEVVGERGHHKKIVVNVTDPRPPTNTRASGCNAKAVQAGDELLAGDGAGYIEDDEMVGIARKAVRMRRLDLITTVRQSSSHE
jgi:GTP-binding protein